MNILLHSFALLDDSALINNAHQIGTKTEIKISLK
jgi:hypothetical protein